MSRSLWMILMSCAAALALPCAAAERGVGSGSQNGRLQIYLPREVTVQDSQLTLGQVSVLRSEGPAAALASKVSLGRFSVPGQTIVLDRATILSRLASEGIPGEKVSLTGARAVTVRRRQHSITGDEFIALARLFLKQHPPVSSPCDGIVAVKPKGLVLPSRPENMELIPRFVDNGARGFVTVQIAVVVDGLEIGLRDIPLRLRYRCRKAVTSQEVAEGAVLTPENTKIEEEVSDQPEAAGWRPPYGLIARRALLAGTELRGDMLGTTEPAVSIRRNETVVIRVQRPGFVVTAVGVALQEAQAGQYVKVRNADSHRVIMCKVSPDGTVEPVL